MKHRSVFIAALATAEALCMAPCMATAEGNPFQFSAHGAVYGTDGQVAATPAFVQLAISHELAELLARASPSQRNQFEDKRRHAASLTRGDAQAGLYTQTLLLDWLLRQVQAADSAEIAGRNRALQRLLRWRPGEALRAWLAQADLSEPARQTAMGGPTPAEQYRAECEALKVPIPRDWGAAGAWTSRGFLKKPFIITTLDAELYIGNPRAGDPKGVCLALPRYDKSQVPEEQAADTFGIICMGEATSPDANGKQRSSACFWDWQNQNRSVPISGEVVPLSEFASAPEFVAGIGGVCSDCHAGQNAFVVHPGDTAFTAGGLNLDATAWVLPKVQATWPQNPIPDRLNTKLNALLAAGDKDCRRCHDMPEIVTTPPLKEYCRNVLWTSLFGRRVPLPDGTAGTAGPTMPITGTAKDYFKIVDALMAECKRAKAVLPPPQAPAAPRVHF